MEKKIKKKPGRKRIAFTDEQLEEIKYLSGLGVSETSIAHKMGISLSTIARRKREKGKFDTVLKEGKIKAVAEVSNALFDSATGRSGNPPNVSAQIFFLKNRGEGVASWSDVQKIENTFSLDNVLTEAKNRMKSISGATDNYIEGEKLDIKELEAKEHFPTNKEDTKISSESAISSPKPITDSTERK